MSKMQSSVVKTRRMVLATLLMTIVIVMGFTPLGFLKVGLLEITFLMIPVVIGASILGPWWGLFLGLSFGFVSFFQCFGYSAFGVALMTVNPLGTFVTCVIPRGIMGYLTGVIYGVLGRKINNKHVPSIISCVVGALINTALFTLSFLIFFRNADLSSSFGVNLQEMNIMDVITILITVNALIEVLVCGVLGSLVVWRIVEKFKVEYKNKK